MTRINLVKVTELTDQHVIAEYREIKMVPGSLARSLVARPEREVLARIPPAFTLNTGHVSFFYDKMQYLAQRHQELFLELGERGFSLDVSAYHDNAALFDGYMYTQFWGDYNPTRESLRIIRARIAEKIAMKPAWYRYMGIPLTDGFCIYNMVREENERHPSDVL